jgi:hypothetical protein
MIKIRKQRNFKTVNEFGLEAEYALAILANSQEGRQKDIEAILCVSTHQSPIDDCPEVR